MNTLRIVWALGTMYLLSACGGADVGESCDEVGSSDECVDGAICTNEGDAAKVCRLSCRSQDDCPSDHDCNGISNSSEKSCQPKAP